MGMKEIMCRMVQSFFIIFTGSVLTMYAFRTIDGGWIVTADITAMLVATIITNAMHLLLYAKKELSKQQLIVRYILALLGVLTTITVTLHMTGYLAYISPLGWAAVWVVSALIFAAVPIKISYSACVTRFSPI